MPQGRLLLSAIFWVSVAAAESASVLYPPQGAVFPPDIAPPAFVWRDPSAAASWRLTFDFADGAPPLVTAAPGTPPTLGPIDPRAIAPTNRPPELPPGYDGAHTWRPSPPLWSEIKQRSRERTATLTITGIPGGATTTVRFRTSSHPVGAPIFYRDVPLMPSETQKGVIKPLPPDAIPLIQWRLRDIAQRESRVVIDSLPTCANCHSFSADGKTLGMDLDGPDSDKGTYTLSSLAPRMEIRREDVMTWNSFPGRPAGARTIGFMSRISPDGRHAVSTVNEEVYAANFRDYRFLQVFYPTRGILAVFSRDTGRIEPLPGADDPRYVHTNAEWSPDGQWIVFARAEARDPYPPGGAMAESANDARELPVRYDLYRVPFNNGRGGRPERIRGASENGRSNSFPRFTPDGRWIVFVQSRNGQLMRPDSELFILPAAGGVPRRMNCNTSRMNSWHSFSPNGRWMVFSSKSLSPYTQMFLTHLDEHGMDSPPILIENATAANRAVNLPEFVNIPPGGLEKIDVPAAEFYRLFDKASAASRAGDFDTAIAIWTQALALEPDDPRAHSNLGAALARRGRFEEAESHLRRALALRPNYPEARYNLDAVLARKDLPPFRDHQRAAANDRGVQAANENRLADAETAFRQALEIDPAFPPALYNLGRVLAQRGQPDAAIAFWNRALEIKPDYAEARFSLAAAEADRNRWAESLRHWREGLAVSPDFVPALKRAAWILATANNSALRNGPEALTAAERAARLTEHRDPEALDALAAAYAEAGRFDDAAATVRQALPLAQQAQAAALRERLTCYEARTPWREPRIH